MTDLLNVVTLVKRLHDYRYDLCDCDDKQICTPHQIVDGCIDIVLDMVKESEKVEAQASEISLLLPCPFCGGEADLCSGMHEWWVKCTSCDASTQMQGMGKRDAAMELWNTRTFKPVSIIEKALESAAKILADFKPEKKRDKLEEWQACYAMLFNLMSHMVGRESRRTAGWVPYRDVIEPALARIKKTMCHTTGVIDGEVVTRIEGRISAEDYDNFVRLAYLRAPERESVAPKEDKFIISEMWMAYVDGKTGISHTNYAAGQSDENAMRNILALLINKGWKQP